MKKALSVFIAVMLFLTSMMPAFAADTVSQEDQNAVLHFGEIPENMISGFSLKSAPNAASASKLLILDVSYHNGTIDWTKVKNDVDGVIIRIGFRGTASEKVNADSKFLDNYKGAKDNGIPVGCYFYSYAKSTFMAKEEANWVISTLVKNNCTMDLPVFFDFEEQDLFEMGKNKCTSINKAFCKRIEQAGYKAGIYSSTYYATTFLNMDALKDYALWIAQWANECTYTASEYDMWQYTASGKVAGVKGDVDLSFCYTDLAGMITEQNRSEPHTFFNSIIVFIAKLLTGISNNIER